MNSNRITRRLSYSNVIASLALFLALGGASYAAVALPAHSVGTKQLKKNAVTAAKIKRNAVGSAKVANGSLRAEDFKSGALPQGPKGDKGDPGAAGPSAGASADNSSGGNTHTPLAELNSTTTVVDLASVNTGGQSHQLTTTFPATIMASAETSIYTDAAASGQAGCELVISNGSGPTNGMTQMADFQYFNFPAVLHYNNAFNVNGSAEKPAGTYNIALRCARVDAAPTFTATRAHIIAWAVQR